MPFAIDIVRPDLEGEELTIFEEVSILSQHCASGRIDAEFVYIHSRLLSQASERLLLPPFPYGR